MPKTIPIALFPPALSERLKSAPASGGTVSTITNAIDPKKGSMLAEAIIFCAFFTSFSYGCVSIENASTLSGSSCQFLSLSRLTAS